MARIKWTKKLAETEALKYKTKNEFDKASYGYEWLRRRGLLDNACKHMTSILTYWSEESAAAEALKYTVRKDFMKSSKGAYEYLRIRKLLDSYCTHMQDVIKWDKDAVFKLALKYTSRNTFQRENAGAYDWLRTNDLLKEATSHMLSHNESRFKGTKNTTGIYILKNNNKVVYIGKSLSCISNRLNSHYNDKRGEFNEVEVWQLSNTADISILEMYLITRYKPVLNVEAVTSQIPTICINNIEQYVDNISHFKDIK